MNESEDSKDNELIEQGQQQNSTLQRLIEITIQRIADTRSLLAQLQALIRPPAPDSVSDAPRT